MPISCLSRFAFIAGFLAAACPLGAGAEPKTVCTITINSADEKEVFQRSLPPDDYRFVELADPQRPDWFASACRQGIRCDALIISGHFDGGTEFYSDRVDARESLSVDEMERASCSDSCSGVFAQLQEVYLFGCNTLNAESMRHASAEITRSLVRSGRSLAEADRVSRALSERHGESNRERMRHIFKDVPVLYGFSSKAPLGRAARPLLESYFRTASTGEIGSGRASARLVGLFAPSSMTVAAGLTDADVHAGFRRDVCHFSDDRLSESQKLHFVHELLGRDIAEVRMFLDPLERYVASLGPAQRQMAQATAALDAIAADTAARERYLAFARDADEPAVQTRMMVVARNLGWLSEAEEKAEFVRLVAVQMSSNAVGSADVDLVCARNANHEFDHLLSRLPAQAHPRSVANAAVLGCLGDRAGHARTLRALTSPNEDDVTLVHVYLRHHPIADVDELRAAVSAVANMADAHAQVRALDALAHQDVADAASLDELARLFPRTNSVAVQRAIAGILIRSDYRRLAKVDLARTLRQYRLKSQDGSDIIDVLIRRLAAS